MVRSNQSVEVYRAQFNLVAHRFAQSRTASVKCPSLRLHRKIAKQLIAGHRSNSTSLPQANHAHSHRATGIQRFTRSEERRLRRVSKDEGPSVATWFETAQGRLLTMRSESFSSLRGNRACRLRRRCA